MTGFLGVPAEVRFMIYGYLFPQEDNYVDDLWPDKNIPNVHTGIIRVNRQLALESLPILYSQTTFHILPTKDAVKWLRTMEHTNRDLLRTVTCDLTSIETDRYVPALFGLLARCSNVSLTLKMDHIKDPEWADSSGFEFFASMHGFVYVSIDAKPNHYHTCSEGHSSEPSCRVLQRRLDNGISKMQSPCPVYCFLHRGQSRNTATASLHINFREECRVNCIGGIFKARWLSDTQNSQSVFQL